MIVLVAAIGVGILVAAITGRPWPFLPVLAIGVAEYTVALVKAGE